MSVTIKDIAVHTGLAISTISKYINGGNVLPENQEKIKKAIDELKFSVNPFARSMKTNKSYTIGIVVDSMTDSHTYEIIDILHKKFAAYGYYCFVGNCDGRRTSQESVVQFLLMKNIDAIIFLGMRVHMKDFDLYEENPIPVISIGDKPDYEKCDQIIVDDDSAVYSAVKYMASEGKFPAYLGGPENEFPFDNRYKGYVSALERCGRKPDKGLISFGECSTESGYLRMKEILEGPNKPEAVMIADHALAVGAYIAIAEKGLKISEDIAVSVFENTELPDSCLEHVNCIVLPTARICSSIVSTIMSKMDNQNDGSYQITHIAYELKISDT